MNTRILHVFGDENADEHFLGALEDGKINKEVLWEQSFIKKSELTYDEGGKEEFCYEAHKFGEVDPRFIEFVKQRFIEDSIYPNNIYTVGNE